MNVKDNINKNRLVLKYNNYYNRMQGSVIP